MRRDVGFISICFALGLLMGCGQIIGPGNGAPAEGLSLADALTINLDREVDIEGVLVRSGFPMEAFRTEVTGPISEE